MKINGYKSIKYRLIAGFAVIICFSFIMGGSSIINIQRASQQTRSMYMGPYEGVKSILSIKSDIIKIHSLMQNISMSVDNQEIIALSQEIKETENKVFEEFKALEQSAISEPQALKELKTQFIDWNPIREEVTNLCLAGMNDIAGKITNEIGSQHVETLTATIEDLTTDAQEKAESFQISADASSKQSLVINSILMIFMAGFSVFTATKTTRSIVPPIKNIQRVTQRLSEGDLEVKQEHYKKDEIGDLAASLAKTIETLNHYISEISYILNLLAQGDMEVSVKGDYQGSFEPIKHSLNQIAFSLNQMLHKIKSTAQIVAICAQNVSTGAKNLSDAVYTQGTSIELLSEHINQIEKQSAENSENASETNSLFEQVMGKADHGSQSMSSMLTSMERIAQSSHNIEKIVKTIEDIAFQTNILSLNASIEAARSGEHGKGFAVVANEVRTLSDKSAEAAKETGELVRNSLQTVIHGEKAADEAAAGLKDIVSGIQEAVILIDKIYDASKKQSKEIGATVQIVEGIVTVVNQTSQIAERSVEESSNMFAQAEILREMTDRFKLRDECSDELLSNEAENLQS